MLYTIDHFLYTIDHFFAYYRMRSIVSLFALGCATAQRITSLPGLIELPPFAMCAYRKRRIPESGERWLPSSKQVY
jgi:hypothetical protein